MIVAPPEASRQLNSEELHADLVVVGGGLAGTCCALTAARAGLQVLVIQDRPVLGGNASSEVRLWTLGATAHMGAPNRWAREGGVIDEILVENWWRNPEGNALLFDTILLEKIIEEPGIRLLLNTAAFEVEKAAGNPDRIVGVRAFCSQNSTLYHAQAPLFVDASGDGIVGFLSGAAFRMGAEAREEFGEPFAPDESYGSLLGHSIYFYSKDTGRPVEYTPPSYALQDVEGEIPRHRVFNAREDGCRLWWIEWGGRLDTVHQTESIKWELWRVVYGVWNYIKNSGKFPEAQNLTLEWVGHIPGKRESRRFEGDTMMRQADVMEQRQHQDAVAFGGWALDLHPADGVFAPGPGCTHWRMRGVYQIPLRALYSRNIENLFLAGRILSSSHVAFGTTRVMATLAHAAQAVGFAAAIATEHSCTPREVGHKYLHDLQRELLRSGQHIPGFQLQDAQDLAQHAAISASSTHSLQNLAPDGQSQKLDKGRAMLLPLGPGACPRFSLWLDVEAPTTLVARLRLSSKPGNFDGGEFVDCREFPLEAAPNQLVEIEFKAPIERARYAYLALEANEAVSVRTSAQRLSGVLCLEHKNTQRPPEGIGVESFEVWAPPRRPGGRNWALQIEPALQAFEPAAILNGLQRPVDEPNCWLADPSDEAPTLHLDWHSAQSISRVEIFFDTDLDHPLESVLMGHPERASPFCAARFRLLDEAGQVLAERDNHQTRATVAFDEPIHTRKLSLQVLAMHGDAPPSVFELRCYA